MHENEDFSCVSFTNPKADMYLHTGGSQARLTTVVFNHLTAVNHCFNASVHGEGWEEGRNKQGYNAPKLIAGHPRYFKFPNVCFPSTRSATVTIASKIQ